MTQNIDFRKKLNRVRAQGEDVRNFPCPWCGGSDVRKAYSYKVGPKRKCINDNCLGFNISIPLYAWVALVRRIGSMK